MNTRFRYIDLYIILIDMAKSTFYIDESGFSEEMPRTHGYTEKGIKYRGTYHSSNID
jgi:hypothetical protein